MLSESGKGEPWWNAEKRHEMAPGVTVVVRRAAVTATDIGFFDRLKSGFIVDLTLSKFGKLLWLNGLAPREIRSRQAAIKSK